MNSANYALFLHHWLQQLSISNAYVIQLRSKKKKQTGKQTGVWSEKVVLNNARMTENDFWWEFKSEILQSVLWNFFSLIVNRGEVEPTSQVTRDVEPTDSFVNHVIQYQIFLASHTTKSPDFSINVRESPSHWFRAGQLNRAGILRDFSTSQTSPRLC